MGHCCSAFALLSLTDDDPLPDDDRARAASTSSIPGSAPIGHHYPRVVFLDIDGVLHSGGAQLFLPECMDALRKIVNDMRGTGIVLSSTWRSTKDSLNWVNSKLREYDMAEVVSCTPLSGWRSRSDEILRWLEEHPTVTHFVVLDDMDLSWPHGESFTRYHVRTDLNTGLTQADAHQAIAILQQHAARSELPVPKPGDSSLSRC
jgi:hypothetical protein